MVTITENIGLSCSYLAWCYRKLRFQNRKLNPHLPTTTAHPSFPGLCFWYLRNVRKNFCVLLCVCISTLRPKCQSEKHSLAAEILPGKLRAWGGRQGKYGFPGLFLAAVYQVTYRGSRGRSQHSKECLTLAEGPRGLSHGVTKFTLPASTLPGQDYIISVTISNQAGGREAGTAPGAHPKPAWEEGRQRPLTHTKPQAGLAPAQASWPQGSFQGQIAVLLP